MSHPEYSPEELDALALYSLDLLEGDERSNLDDHLRAGCTHCELHLREFRKAAASFTEHAAPLVAPPVTLRTRVLALTDISALSSSPDSQSEPGQSSRSQEATFQRSPVGEPFGNGSEPTAPNQEHAPPDAGSRLVNSPRVPVDPPAQRVEHKLTTGKHLPLRAPTDGQTPSPEQQG